jgi:hypothetical protein
LASSFTFRPKRFEMDGAWLECLHGSGRSRCRTPPAIEGCIDLVARCLLALASMLLSADCVGQGTMRA